MKKFVGLNERTCQNQKPIVKPGDKVEKGQVIADGAATQQGELALGRNVLVGFMSFDGYNFEDAIIISEELVRNDTYTSHPHRRVRRRNPRDQAGPRGVHPRHSQRQREGPAEPRRERHRAGRHLRPARRHSGRQGLAQVARPNSRPEEKLLHAIFGRAGEDVKNDSLEVPSGIEGIVIDTQKFSRRMSLSEEERKVFEKDLKEAEIDRQQARSRSTSARWSARWKSRSAAC